MDENQIIVRQELTPVSFISKDDVLSKGQQYLFDLICERLKEGRPISKDDIVDVYIKANSKDGETIRVRYGLGQSYFHCENMTRERQEVRSRAISWFKQNLGACIIKGKLLAIPVIETK